MLFPRFVHQFNLGRNNNIVAAGNYYKGQTSTTHDAVRWPEKTSEKRIYK